VVILDAQLIISGVDDVCGCPQGVSDDSGCSVDDLTSVDLLRG
jgi:hypothetical protein